MTPDTARPEDRETERATSCGLVALIGAPNAGKSTLVNALVGAKVAIVTHKVQTTRARLRAVAIVGDAQLVLVDTPGIFAPKRRLDRAMVETAWESARDADIVVAMIDAAKGLSEETRLLLETARGLDRPLAIALNKIDRVERPRLLEMTAKATELSGASDIFLISALNGDGLKDLTRFLAAHVPPGPWLFPEDQLADAPLRQTAAEITREKLMLRVHQELPYASTVETTDWKTLRDGSVRIEQTIYVERASQKKIVLGEKGRTIKQISMDARKDIAAVTDTRVHLFLFVKVRENWGNDPERYREMGLEFPTE